MPSDKHNPIIIAKGLIYSVINVASS